MSGVERAARALAKREYPDQPDAWHDGCWAEWLDGARAVLEAIREPSDTMLAAAKPEPAHLYGEGNRGSEYQKHMRASVSVERLVARQTWHAMIDAALSDDTAS